MQPWYGYIDESYNTTTFCVGGFFAPARVWRKIGDAWTERIAYENRKSIKKGFPPITRYHATYCANLKGEFSEERGWDIERQIRLTKRLCEILRSHRPNGLVVGGSFEDVRPYLDPREDAKAVLYSLCFKMILFLVTTTLHELFPETQVSITYDRGEFEPLGRAAGESFMQDEATIGLREYLLGVESKAWEECVELQPADFMAYEGMKRVNSSIKGSDAIRKSLQGLLGNIPISISHFQQQNFVDILRIHENVTKGQPIEEGVESGPGLVECTGDL